MTATMTAMTRMMETYPQCEFPSCMRRASVWRRFSGEREGVRVEGRWYCSPECFEKAAVDIYARLLPSARRRDAKRHRIPLGLVLFSQGLVTQSHLQAALQSQRESGGRVGEWLRQHGAVNENQVTTALAMQWSRPVFPLEGHRRFLECANLIPAPMLESARMVPVHHVAASKLLYVAFAESIDYTILYGIEQMLDVRTEPCLAQESTIARAMEELRQRQRPSEVLFDCMTDPREMGATTRSYAVQLAADDVRIVSCGEYIWSRIESRGQTHNLLFQIPQQ